jgi:hypothetical protein
MLWRSQVFQRITWNPRSALITRAAQPLLLPRWRAFPGDTHGPAGGSNMQSIEVNASMWRTLAAVAESRRN